MPATDNDLGDILAELRRVAALADKHEVELHGPRGIYMALDELYDLMQWNNRALWAVAAAIVAAAALTALGLN